MLRIAKMTDYGVLIMATMAHAPERLAQARDVAEQTGIGLPTVSKLLKRLAHQGLLVSYRGVKGGYQLQRAPQDISVHAIIAALEGPIALTECGLKSQVCRTESRCALKTPWLKVNDTVAKALDNISLANLVHSTP